ncbi:hypothetical protein [Ghiorsea bivora]|uniref:hypothetical protein n=1 Tax=Ghiorsea bivora TaxID=1485545 RepID=UPI0012FD8877|nr:hypothetical protein [Ghiorsea bivora]
MGQNDAITLNPIEVDKVVQCMSQSKLLEFISTTDVRVSIAGGCFGIDVPMVKFI